MLCDGDVFPFPTVDLVLACAQSPLDSHPSSEGSSDMGEKEEWTVDDMHSDKDCPLSG